MGDNPRLGMWEVVKTPIGVELKGVEKETARRIRALGRRLNTKRYCRIADQRNVVPVLAKLQSNMDIGGRLEWLVAGPGYLRFVLVNNASGARSRLRGDLRVSAKHFVYDKFDADYLGEKKIRLEGRQLGECSDKIEQYLEI